MWRRLQSPSGRLAPLTALSIAVSVALATGLEMSSRSAQVQLEQTGKAMAGAARIEVTSGRVGVSESVLDEVRAVPGVLAASPLISAKLRLVDKAFVINVIGVDFLAEDQVRPVAVDSGGIRVRDPLRLLTAPGAVVLTQELIDRLNLSENWDLGKPVVIPVRVDGKEKSLSVQGLLEPGGIAAAFGGQVALMDIFALQALVGRAGIFDRIDVVPADGVAVAHLIDALSGKLRGVASVHASSTRTSEIDQAIDMIRIAALVVAGAGALAACLLAYASTAQWVDRQRKQLATLRAVGMEANRVQRGVFLEVGLLAVAGTGAGILGGIALSPTLLSTLSRFAVGAGGEGLTTLSVHPSTIAIALPVG